MLLAKILVVNDDIATLDVVKIILENEGHTTETLSDWKMVFDKISEYKPQLILLDIFISGADGRVICKELKKSKTTKQIPVILFSATYRLEAYTKDSGAQGYLQKPFENLDLISIVKNTLSRQPLYK